MAFLFHLVMTKTLFDEQTDTSLVQQQCIFKTEFNLDWKLLGSICGFDLKFARVKWVQARKQLKFHIEDGFCGYSDVTGIQLN